MAAAERATQASRRRHRIALRAAIGAVLLWVAGCAQDGPRYLTEPEHIAAAGRYVHAPTGQAFPLQVADFRRSDIAHYETSVPDIEVSYEVAAGEHTISANVLLRPATRLLTVGESADAVARARADACRREREAAAHTFAFYSVAERVSAKAVEVNKNDIVRAGWLAEFSFQAMYQGQRQALRTQYVVFCRAAPGWTLTFEFTYPEDVEATDPIARFMGALTWTGKLAG